MPHHGGTFPALIRWPEDVPSPSRTLSDEGLALSEFRLAGPEALQRDLAALGADRLINGFDIEETPAFHLILQSPQTGVVHLF